MTFAEDVNLIQSTLFTMIANKDPEQDRSNYYISAVDNLTNDGSVSAEIFSLIVSLLKTICAVYYVPYA